MGMLDTLCEMWLDKCMTNEDLASSIVAELRRCGLSAQLSESGISESFYVSLDDGELRVSDHDLPATYAIAKGRNWIDAFAETPRAGAVHWSLAVLRLVSAAGYEPSAWLAEHVETGRATVARVKNLQALEAERIAAQQRVDVDRKADNEALLAAHGKSHLTGAARKRWLKKMRDRGAE